MPNLLENDSAVAGLRDAFYRGEASLKAVPGLIKRILMLDMWQERMIHETKQVQRFDSFMEFVTAKPLEGLGADMALLKNLCRDDTEALDLLDKVIQRPNGGDRKSDGIRFDNVQTDAEIPPTGNTSAAALRRLRKDSPGLHQKVIRGEMSPHGAMVQAGFRRKTITVPCDPQKAADAIRRHFSPEQIAEIAIILGKIQS